MHFFIPGQRDEWARLCWFEHAFTEDECDQIIQLAKDVEKQWTTTGNNISAIESRKSRIAWISSTPQSKWLYEKLAEIIMDVNNERYKFELTGITENLQYNESDKFSYSNWRQDFAPGSCSTRKLSLFLNLSDQSNYHGGNLELFEEKAEIPRSQGTVFIFPSFEFHRVSKITEGVRQSLVSWASGPTYR